MCVYGRGECRAWEHTNALGAGPAPAKETSVYKVQVTNNREDHPKAQAAAIFVLSLSPPDVLARGVEGRLSCALEDFCDLRRLHHGFLEEGLCLREGQQRLWGPSQTLVPRGSLGGEAVLLVCWQRLEAVHQRPWQLLAWKAPRRLLGGRLLCLPGLLLQPRRPRLHGFHGLWAGILDLLLFPVLLLL